MKSLAHMYICSLLFLCLPWNSHPFKFIHKHYFSYSANAKIQIWVKRGERDSRPHCVLPMKLFRPCISYQLATSQLPIHLSLTSLWMWSTTVRVPPLPAGTTSHFVTRGCYVEKGAFFLSSECSSHRFLDLWLLLFLVPAFNSSRSPHGWWHPAIKNFLDVPSGGLTMQCCSEALPHEQHQWLPYGQFYSVFWAVASLVDGFPWNNRERFSSKL